MLRRLYDWIIGLSAHPKAVWILGLIAFIESSVFPIPPDVLLIPMILANRRRAFLYAAIATLSSVAGGLLGYAIGFYLYESFGRAIIAFYHIEPQFQAFQQQFAESGWWIIVIKGATPIPYKLVTIAAGVAHFSIPAFIGASIISRAMRFFLVAALLWRFGEPIRDFIEKYLTWVTTGAVVLLVGGFVILKYL